MDDNINESNENILMAKSKQKPSLPADMDINEFPLFLSGGGQLSPPHQSLQVPKSLFTLCH